MKNKKTFLISFFILMLSGIAFASGIKYNAVVVHALCKTESFNGELRYSDIYLVSDYFKNCNNFKINNREILDKSFDDIRKICYSKSVSIIDTPVLFGPSDAAKLDNDIKDFTKNLSIYEMSWKPHCK